MIKNKIMKIYYILKLVLSRTFNPSSILGIASGLPIASSALGIASPFIANNMSHSMDAPNSTQSPNVYRYEPQPSIVRTINRPKIREMNLKVPNQTSTDRMEIDNYHLYQNKTLSESAYKSVKYTSSYLGNKVSKAAEYIHNSTQLPIRSVGASKVKAFSNGISVEDNQEHLSKLNQKYLEVCNKRNSIKEKSIIESTKELEEKKIELNKDIRKNFYDIYQQSISSGKTSEQAIKDSQSFKKAFDEAFEDKKERNSIDKLKQELNYDPYCNHFPSQKLKEKEFELHKKYKNGPFSLIDWLHRSSETTIHHD
jgi:hypothetical protein